MNEETELDRWPWLAEDEGELQRRADREQAARDHEEAQDALVRLVHLPAYRHAGTAAAFGGAAVGRTPDAVASAKLVADQCAEVRNGNLALPTDILTAQAMTLDAMFSELVKRSGNNMGDYPEAAERYMRMAMKTQAQCRATIEALGKLTRGGEQVVKHVHIDNRGGQAVVTETVQTGGGPTRGDIQSHGSTSVSVEGAPLLGHDAGWRGVPMPGDEGQEAVPVARRESGRADG